MDDELGRQTCQTDDTNKENLKPIRKKRKKA